MFEASAYCHDDVPLVVPCSGSSIAPRSLVSDNGAACELIAHKLRIEVK